MKPIQSSVPEMAGDLLPAFAAKGEAVSADTFQAALALALQGMGKVPLVPPPPKLAVVPTVPALPMPAEESPATKPEAHEVPAVPTARQRPVPTSFPMPGLVSVPRCLESRPKDAPKDVARPVPSSEQEEKKSAVPAKPGDGVASSPGTPGQQADPLILSVVAAEIFPIRGRPVTPDGAVPEPVDAPHESVPASATPKSRTWTPQGSPRQQPASPPVAPVPPNTPEPRAPSDQHRSPREPAVPAPRIESYPTGRAERPEVPAQVKVEEVRVETRAAVAPPQVQSRRLQREVEVADRQGESPAGTPRSEGLAPQSRQPSTRDGATAAEAPAPLRHPEDAPANAGATDRVTLHLPDEAGGGRIQIAVRGDVVHARIVSADEAGTREMEAGLDELRGALTRQGFQEAHVKAESRPAPDTGWMPAAAARESAGAGDSRPRDAGTQDRREREQRQPDDPRSDAHRQRPDGRSHHRSRRERER